MAAGCEVTIRQPGSSEEITGYTVSGVAENKTDRTLLDVSVDLPEGVLEPGMAADVEIVHKSENYAAILPIQAVHEGQNRYYVLALQEERSVLGTELVAKRYEVEVLEKNSEYAAIADGALTADQEIVSSSTRAIGDGSRVRRDEE